MRRWVKVGIGAACVPPVAFLGLFGWAYWSVSNPKVEHPPLPAALIALPSPEGEALRRAATATADLEPLLEALQTQEKGSWCGVASSATVLSALRGERFAQDDFFTHETAEIRHWLRVTFGGMTLDQLGALLETHEVEVTVHHAGDGVDVFRRVAVDNLSRPGDYLLVNYVREPLGQGRTGHISPVGAYDAASDRFLVLDVASYKWPPVWVQAETLYAAMDTVDPESGATRGWVEVSPR